MTTWSPRHICGCTLILQDGEPVDFETRCPLHLNALPGDVAGVSRALQAVRVLVAAEAGDGSEPFLELDEGLTQATATFVDFMAGIAVQEVSGPLSKEDFIAAVGG